MSQELDEVKETLVEKFKHVAKYGSQDTYSDLAKLAKALAIVEHEQEEQKAKAAPIKTSVCR